MQVANSSWDLRQAADRERDFHSRLAKAAADIAEAYRKELRSVELGERPIVPGRFEELRAGLARAEQLHEAERAEYAKALEEHAKAVAS